MVQLADTSSLKGLYSGFESRWEYFIGMAEWHTQQAQTLSFVGSNPTLDIMSS